MTGGEASTATERPWRHLGWLFALLLLCGLLRRLAPSLLSGGLPESFFHTSVFASSWIRDPRMLIVIGICALPLRHLRQEGSTWRALFAGKMLRVLAGTSALILAYSFATQAPNGYLDQSFAFDRWILIGLALAVCVHPAWIPLFLFQSLLWLAQFAHPLGMIYTPTVELRLPLDLLWVLATYAVLRAVRPQQVSVLGREPTLLLVMLTVLSASYVFPGLEKLRISPHLHEWVLDNDLSWLWLEASRRGWGLALPASTFEGIRQLLSSCSPLLLAGSLVLELSAVLLLAGRRPALWVLPALVSFHLLSALVAGFFFWKWILVDLAALFAFWRMDAPTADALTRVRSRALGGALLLMSLFFLQPNRLGWFERPYSNHFRFELEGQSGARYSTDPSTFEPFDLTFAYDRFHFLTEPKALRGQKNYEAIRALRDGGAKNLEAVRQEFGRDLHDPAKRERLDKLLQRFFTNRNQRLTKPRWWTRLSPPAFQIRWVNRDPLPYHDQEPIVRVRIREIEEYFEADGVVPVQDQWIHEVEIPGPPTLRR